MTDFMDHIRKRFPGKSDTIASAMAADPDFLEICEDYKECLLAYQYWTKSKKPEARARVGEYRTLISELEDEILEVLKVGDQQK